MTVPPVPRSPQRLRLEQIAIWGDAAFTTRCPPKPISSPTSAPTHTAPLDITTLTTPTPPSTNSDPLHPLSHCHSFSAHVFRHSGRHVPVKPPSTPTPTPDPAERPERASHSRLAASSPVVGRYSRSPSSPLPVRPTRHHIPGPKFF